VAGAGKPGTGTGGCRPGVIPNGQVCTFSIELGDEFVRPSSVSVPYGTRVVLHVVDHGTPLD
jgi:hypothetical protein